MCSSKIRSIISRNRFIQDGGIDPWVMIVEGLLAGKLSINNNLSRVGEVRGLQMLFTKEDKIITTKATKQMTNQGNHKIQTKKVLQEKSILV
jgi:hypothetical protein